MSNLIFKNINFEHDSGICIKFREDSTFTSFGVTEPFHEHDGKGSQRYLDWLKKRIGSDYKGIHIWYEDQIIGQLELGRRKKEDSFGYVNLYYLIPEMRGKGLSDQLDEFVVTYLKQLGFTKARLSVSPTNLRAVRFYKRNGWKDLGLRDEPGRTGKPLEYPVHYMEKIF